MLSGFRHPLSESWNISPTDKRGLLYPKSMSEGVWEDPDKGVDIATDMNM
jgi:hypothetical protein